MRTIGLATMCAALALTGCETAPPMETPSGRPEIVINAPIPKIQSAIANSALNHGSTVEEQSANSMTIQTIVPPDKQWVTALVCPSRQLSPPVGQTRLTMVSIDGGTRVVEDWRIVCSPGTPLQQILPVPANQKTGAEAMERLQRIKSEVEAG